jgi:hypothetical protein
MLRQPTVLTHSFSGDIRVGPKDGWVISTVVAARRRWMLSGVHLHSEAYEETNRSICSDLG